MKASIRYVGHATVLLELDGVRLLTDPLLRGRVAHLRRISPVPAGDAADVDAVLLSHLHLDHADVASLRLLRAGTAVVAPRAAGAFLRRCGLGDVREVAAGESLDVAAVRVHAVGAVHDGRRFRVGRRVDALGYVVGGTRRIYFAGDTDLFDGMRELGPLDVALLPIGGWGPRVGHGHLDPLRAAQALALLRAPVAIPIHWGTYVPLHRRSPYRDPTGAFVEAAAAVAPDTEIRVLGPGERTTV